MADGGGFVGICAGAYLASIEYPWSLGLLNAHVVDDEHWARGVGNVQLRISPIGQAALTADKEICTIHFENGPLLDPATRKTSTNTSCLPLTTRRSPKRASHGRHERFGGGRPRLFWQGPRCLLQPASGKDAGPRTAPPGGRPLVGKARCGYGSKLAAQVRLSIRIPPSHHHDA